jgi:hypothetical protein
MNISRILVVYVNMVYLLYKLQYYMLYVKRLKYQNINYGCVDDKSWFGCELSFQLGRLVTPAMIILFSVCGRWWIVLVPYRRLCCSRFFFWGGGLD